MSDFTYQTNETSVALETYEWDRTWIERTEITDAKRVFYIGDSISWGVRPAAQKTVGQEFLFDALASSKALDNPFFLPTLDLFLRQVPSVDLMIVNNGLHGWHLEDETAYAQAFDAFVKALQQRCPSVAVVLTTAVADEKRNARVQIRNSVARRIAEERGCPVIDLYAPSLSCTYTDGVHFNGEGYQTLAEALVSAVRPLL